MRRLLPAIILVMMCAQAAPLPAAAFNPFGKNVCFGQTASAAACNTSNSDPISGPKGILLKVANIIAYFAGAVALIMILVGALRYITSGSDLSTGSRTDTDVEEAKSTIASALIGLAVIILAKVIISFVIRKL